MSRAARGFTLIEMAMVLLIIAIGSALVVPMIEGGFDSREVRRAARQIAATMHYCRGEAVAVGKPQELVIVQATNAIQTTGGRSAVLSDRAVIEPIRGGFNPAPSVAQILFHPNGATSGGGFSPGLSLRCRQVDVAWEDGIGVKTYTLKSLRAAPEND